MNWCADCTCTDHESKGCKCPCHPKLAELINTRSPTELMKIFEDSYVRQLAKRYNESWSQQPREERKRRMHFVLRMAAELAEIRKVTNFSTGWCEMAIEDVIMGDLDSLRYMGVEGLSAKGFEENVGGPEGARYAEIFAKFQEICEEAYLSAKPKERV